MGSMEFFIINNILFLLFRGCQFLYQEDDSSIIDRMATLFLMAWQKNIKRMSLLILLLACHFLIRSL